MAIWHGELAPGIARYRESIYTKIADVLLQRDND
jgi:hypothetical protein